MPTEGPPSLFDLNPNIVFVYRGQEVHYDEDRLVNLNQMWEAAGRPNNKDPRRWADNPGGRQFIANLARRLNVGKTVIWKSRRGKHLGGTWSDWRIAVAYAEYLSPDFHLFVIEAFREWAEEQADPDLKAQRAVEGYRRKGWDDDRIMARLEGIVERKSLTDTLKEHGVYGVGYALCTDAINKEVLGKTAKEIKLARGLKPNARTRDYMESHELAAIRFAEAMAKKRVGDSCTHGISPCCRVCHQAGSAVHQALVTMGMDPSVG